MTIKGIGDLLAPTEDNVFLQAGNTRCVFGIEEIARLTSGAPRQAPGDAFSPVDWVKDTCGDSSGLQPETSERLDNV